MVSGNTLGSRHDTDWIVSNSFLLLLLLYYFTNGMYSSKIHLQLRYTTDKINAKHTTLLNGYLILHFFNDMYLLKL